MLVVPGHDMTCPGSGEIPASVHPSVCAVCGEGVRLQLAMAPKSMADFRKPGVWRCDPHDTPLMLVDSPWIAKT